MKMQTEIHLMIRNVGEAGSEEKMEHVAGSLKEVCTHLIQWFSTHRLLKRWDFVIARTKEECETRLRITGRAPKAEQETSSQQLDLDALKESISAIFTDEDFAS